MTELPSDARRLAVDCQFLMASSVAARRELGLQIDSIYRNANVRISVSERLLNDLMPPREPEYQRFAETVLGHPVQGVSLAKSQAAVRMLPDPNQARPGVGGHRQNRGFEHFAGRPGAVLQRQPIDLRRYRRKSRST